MQYEPSELAWRTSSYSSGNGQCVEVADVRGATGRGSVVPVRDSKNRGPVVTFSSHSWGAFVAGMKEAHITD
ncbi:DUF397 domain-containing protein [Streptomyces sp. NPDC001279]|uniref:DUF397 domain-containing protein n=1 Tax=Streptomyces sp. NPDC001279 TaxID=3364556 RepID=UPI00367EBBE8